MSKFIVSYTQAVESDSSYLDNLISWIKKMIKK
jgi:hypothetical protein